MTISMNTKVNDKTLTFDEAAQAICGYCADPDRWLPAKKGTYPEWWHLFKGGGTVRNKCSAWAIWHTQDMRRKGVY